MEKNIVEAYCRPTQIISNENSLSLEFYFVTLMIYCLECREILMY
jgi:hypothetical protein